MADPEAIKNYEQKFEEIYASKIKPKIAALEKERIRVSKICAVCGILSLILFFILFLMFFIAPIFGKSGEVSVFIIFLVCFPLLVIFLVIFGSVDKQYRDKVKSQLLPFVLSVFGDFRLDSGAASMPLNIIQKYGLFPAARIKIDDDHVSGTYEGISVNITETRLIHSKGGKNNRGTVVDFYGLIIKLKQAKKYSGVTVVASSKSSRPIDLEKVELEDAKFNKIFDVYTNDQVEARYLLTTALMERMKVVCTNSGIKGISCIFINDICYLFLDYQDTDACNNLQQKGYNTNFVFFEVGGIFRPLDNKDAIKAPIMQLSHIFDIIQCLKISQNIGL